MGTPNIRRTRRSNNSPAFHEIRSIITLFTKPYAQLHETDIRFNIHQPSHAGHPTHVVSSYNVTKRNITRITVCVRNYKTTLNKRTSLSTLSCHITLQYFYVHSNQTLYYIDYSLSLLPTYFTMPSDHTHSTPMVNREDFIHILFINNTVNPV
jgi:hypothetical protein